MNKLVALLFFAVAVHAQYNCAPTVGGYKYDLTRLYHADGEPDSITYYDNYGNQYFLNLCGHSTAPCDETDTSVCQRASNFIFYSCGLLNTQTMEANPDVGAGQGLIVKYSGGTRCSGGPSRSTTVKLTCLSTEDPGYIYDQAEGDCSYTLYMYSAAACGKKVGGGGGGIGAGSIILIILVCLVVLYFGLGAVYQWKFKEAKEPVEFIIHREFWFAIPALVKDGVLFIAHGFKKGDYVTV